MPSITTRRERLALLEFAFEERFGALEPGRTRAYVRAPGRIDLMGSHTDYNEGRVLALAIDLDTWVLAAARDDGRIRVASLQQRDVVDVALDGGGLDERDAWARYVVGVARAYERDGIDCTGFDAIVDGRVPLASGLSSSAALEVATALAIETLAGRALAPIARARACQRAENEYVGVACGLLDPYCAVFGRAGSALALDFRAQSHRDVSLPPDVAIVVGDTRAPRGLASSQYGERRAQCEEGVRRLAALRPGIRALRDVEPEEFDRLAAKLPDIIARRCRFVVEEDVRVAVLATALEQSDRETLCALFAASFEGARTLYEICIPEMEAMRDAMLAAPGCIGARQAGAGFGGCLVALVERGRVDAFCDAAARGYAARAGRPGAVFPVESADGAGPV